MATDNSDQFNFRTGSADKKKDFQKRTTKLREEKNVLAREIYEDGLLVNEAGQTESQILKRRNKAIAERDIFLNLLLEKNNMIKSYNNQLRRKNKRYSDYTAEKDVVKIYDKDGNEFKIEFDF